MHPPTLPLNSTLLLHPGLTLPTLPCVQEYCYLKCAVMQVANLGVQGIPTGPLAGCPCCATARSIDIDIDIDFGLGHLSLCASSDVLLEPPNQRLSLRVEEVGRLLSDVIRSASGTAAAVDDAPCSDFDACA